MSYEYVGKENFKTLYISSVSLLYSELFLIISKFWNLFENLKFNGKKQALLKYSKEKILFWNYMNAFFRENNMQEEEYL